MLKRIVFASIILLTLNTIYLPLLLAVKWDIFYGKNINGKREIVAIKYKNKTFFYRTIKNKLIDINNIDDNIIATWCDSKEELIKRLLNAWLFFTDKKNQGSFFDVKADCYARIITKMLKDDYRRIDCEAEWYGNFLATINKKYTRECQKGLVKYQQHTVAPIAKTSNIDSN